MAKTVLISGGTSGIGRAAVLRLLEDGFNVAAFSRNKDKCDKLEKELKKHEGKYLVLDADVADETAVKKVVEETIERFGSIDILINNAGVAYYVACDEVDTDKLHQMIHTNILGVMLLTKHVVPHMKKNKSGLILNIASISGKSAFPKGEFYSATKYAIMGYSEGLRKELKEYKIKVSTICPGMIKTELFGEKELQRRKELWKGELPVMMEPEDISNVISMICSQPERCEIRDLTIMPFPFRSKLE